MPPAPRSLHVDWSNDDVVRASWRGAVDGAGLRQGMIDNAAVVAPLSALSPDRHDQRAINEAFRSTPVVKLVAGAHYVLTEPVTVPEGGLLYLNGAVIDDPAQILLSDGALIVDSPSGGGGGGGTLTDYPANVYTADPWTPSIAVPLSYAWNVPYDVLYNPDAAGYGFRIKWTGAILVPATPVNSTISLSLGSDLITMGSAMIVAAWQVGPAAMPMWVDALFVNRGAGPGAGECTGDVLWKVTASPSASPSGSAPKIMSSANYGVTLDSAPPAPTAVVITGNYGPGGGSMFGTSSAFDLTTPPAAAGA